MTNNRRNENVKSTENYRTPKGKPVKISTDTETSGEATRSEKQE